MQPLHTCFYLLQLSRPWLQTLGGGLGLLLLQMVLTALLVPLARQLEPLIHDFQWPVFFYWLCGVLALYAGRNLCLGWQQYFFGMVSLQACQSYQHRLHGHILTQMSWPDWQQHPTGDWLVNLQDDVDKVRLGLLKLWSEAIPGLSMFLTMLGLAAWYNWRLTLMLLLLLPFMAGLLHWFGHYIQQASGQVQQRQGQLQQFMWESVQYWLTLVITKAHVARSQQFLAQQQPLLVAQRRLLKWTATQPAVIGFAQVLLIGVLLLYSGWEITQGWLSGADLLAFAAAIALSVDPLLMLTGAMVPLQIAAGSLARLRQIETNAPHQPLVRPCEDVLFRLVAASLQHPEGAWQLQGIDLSLKPKERIALVGPSGAGKSSLLLVAAGIYPLTQGMLYQDTTKTVVLLTQTPPVFSLSLRANITLGRTVSQTELEHVLHICQLTERLKQWPQGLDSLVGAAGVHLSGGEKQLIAFARALIAQPDALLLDEATSEMDTPTETRLLAAIEQVFPELAWIMVAHRFSSLQSTALRYVMSEGQIRAKGTHLMLSETDALYQSLWQQAGAHQDNLRQSG